MTQSWETQPTWLKQNEAMVLVNKGRRADDSFEEEQGESERMENKRPRLRRWSLHFLGPFCFNQKSEAPAGEARGPRNVPAWLKEGDQSKPGAAAQMLCCSVTNAHMNMHAHWRWQWWIGKRSDSLEVIDFPLLHNKLSHDLISRCSFFLSSLNCSFLFFEPTLDCVRLRRLQAPELFVFQL